MSNSRKDPLDIAVEEVEELIDTAYEEIRKRRKDSPVTLHGSDDGNALNGEVQTALNPDKVAKSKGKKSKFVKSVILSEILKRKF